MLPRYALPRICIALGLADTDTLLAHARQELEAGENFLEFRLDYLPEPEQGLLAMKAFLQQHPDCVILATCRRAANHGRFRGSIGEQIALLEAAIAAGARAVDVEIETAENAVSRVEALRAKTTVVLSYHNYESTPAMEAVLRRMQRVGADAYKIVTTARKPTDISRVLTLGKAHPKTTLVLLTMGEVGFASRILAPSHGSWFTYAAPLSAEGTAAGQVNARLLRHLYRVEKLTRSAKVYGVIADPVRHSLSPVIHNRAFQARRMDAVYLPFLVQPTQLRDFMQFAEALPVAGFSVTIPHKQKILRYLDLVDPLARRIGAVNTVWRRGGKWRGSNTDVLGVTVPLSKHLRLPKATVLLAGTGGAARAAAFALTDAGAQVAITGRTPAKVQALAKVCGAEALPLEQAISRHFDALINATPVGMYPHVDDCFFPDTLPADLIFDMVYNPLETTLLQRAQQQGKAVIAGWEMFLEQAVQQFETWAGESAPRAVMERAIREALTPSPEEKAAGEGR